MIESHCKSNLKTPISEDNASAVLLEKNGKQVLAKELETSTLDFFCQGQHSQ